MEDTKELGVVWADTQAALPPNWQLDGLRCASTGLAPDQRSEEWVAVAVGPDRQERRFQAEDPSMALEGLARSVGRQDG